MQDIIEKCKSIFSELDRLEINDRIEAINRIREALSDYSPFNEEPVDCVQWVSVDSVIANAYNPNRVAPPRNWEWIRTRFCASSK